MHFATPLEEKLDVNSRSDVPYQLCGILYYRVTLTARKLSVFPRPLLRMAEGQGLFPLERSLDILEKRDVLGGSY